MEAADNIATASFVVSLIAAAVSIYAIFKSNRNSSVATLVSLNQGWSQAWKSFLTSKDDEERFFNLAELMNLLEIACGIQVEHSLFGMSRIILTDYLDDSLTLLIDNSFTNVEIAKMLHSPKTFRNVKQIIKSKPKYLSVTVPLKWFQQSLRPKESSTFIH